MKPYKRIVSILVLFLLLASSGATTALTAVDEDTTTALRRLEARAVAAGLTAPARQASGPLIVDHTVVDQYDDIPQEWIDEVKKMWLNVPGESHSSGYRIGLALLEDIDSRYQVNVTEENPPEPYTDEHLRISQITWGAYGWNKWGYGEADWYTNDGAITKTINHLDYCNTNDMHIAAMGFGWCWDMTWHNSPTGTVDSLYQVRWAGSSVGGPDGDRAWGLDEDDVALVNNRVTMDTYLAATQAYVDHVQAQGYTTTVFFTTGPVDGGAGESGYQRQLKHEHIRNYVLSSSDLVLFDYADILSWSDADEQNLQTWTDHGGNPKQYQMIHSDNRQDLDGDYEEDGDHIGEVGAIRLAKALWWMLARLAGWDGVAGNAGSMSIDKAASAETATEGDTLTYRIILQGTNMPPTATVSLTDTVPAGLTYIPGSLDATSGSEDDGMAPELHWSGVLTPTTRVTVTYGVTVTAATSQSITNTAVATAPGHDEISSAETIAVTQPVGPIDLTPSFKSVSSPTAEHGEQVTYTVGIRNAPGPFSATVLFTDTLQNGLAYVPGSFIAIVGTLDDSQLPTLTWSGTLTPSADITLTYAAVVTYVNPASTAILPATLVNEAIIAAPGYQTVTRTATLRINQSQNQTHIYLPLVLRQP